MEGNLKIVLKETLEMYRIFKETSPEIDPVKLVMLKAKLLGIVGELLLLLNIDINKYTDIILNTIFKDSESIDNIVNILTSFPKNEESKGD